MSTFFDACGHFGLYAFMLLCLILGGMTSAKTEELRPTGIALAAVLAVFVLQYTARRVNTEIRERLAVEPFGESASRGVSDTIALWSVVVGLLTLIILVVTAVLLKNPPLCIDGLCLFVFFQFLAMAAASPEYLGLRPAEDITMRGQAIGIPKLAAKLFLASVPVTFGLAAILGCFSMLYAIVLLFSGTTAFVGICGQAFLITVVFSSLPLFAVGLFGAGVVLIRLLEKIVE